MKNYVITIGRQFGSGGRELGKLVASKLGIPYYDKQLLHDAAANAGMDSGFFVNNDERVPTFINGAIPFNFGTNPMPWYSGTSAISDDTLYKAQSDFIQSIASQGPCVIVGRSADYVLREHPGLVSVFVHADAAACTARILQRGDCSDAAKARKMAEKINKLRANYYNFYTDKRWGDASSYHITLDSSILPMDDIADLVVEYVRRRTSNA